MENIWNFFSRPSTIYSEKWREVWIDNLGRNSHFYSNRVTNTKYSVLTFLPKNLFEQFSRFMNRYFLLIACLQLIPLLTPVSPVTTWFPLLFIFAISAIKEAIDDYKRYQADKQANERLYTVIRNGTEVSLISADICVGDIVKVTQNIEFPCDLVLLASSEENGSCYITTANIDGETDLKSRVLPTGFTPLPFAEFRHHSARIHCPHPNKYIYSFDATLSIDDSNGSTCVFSLDTKQLLLQGTFLKNTDYVFGIAVYTGNETKLGNNKSKPSTKVTKLDKLVDYGCLLIFSFQISLVIIFGVTGNILSFSEFQNKHTYLDAQSELSKWYQYFIIPGRMLLLFSFMIPISLKVSLDIVKYIAAQFIDWVFSFFVILSQFSNKQDPKMYYEPLDEPAHAANTSLSEELGQIQYLFSDKTGTLTENIMVLKLCTIQGTIYGSESQGDEEECDVSNDVRLSQYVGSSNGKISSYIHHFFSCLALCHSVVRSKTDSSFCGSSPDEEALVSAAAKLKFEFLGKTGDTIHVLFGSSRKKFTLLHVLEFSSDRKRMSVVVRDDDSQDIFIYTKGADDVVIDTCIPSDEFSSTMKHLDRFAASGYRTLCVAYKQLNLEFYDDWKNLLHEASTAMENRDKKVEECYRMLENELCLLGASAIEDRLQDEVPSTIKTLRNAGIKIWMLTGDKRETAVQIGQSCNLILQDTQETHIHLESTGKSYVDLKVMIDQFSSVLGVPTDNSSRPKDFCVIVDGNTIRKIFEDDLCIESFISFALLAKSVICCRVSPHQKSSIVNLVMKKKYTTLAIGDGGNDVAMIQSAHVGVGIKGREGRQASRAADYSIARFKFLSRLILVHGRYAYKRTAFVALYCIYKSIFLGLMQVFYQFYTGFSGTSLFSAFALSSYNVFFTGLPIIFFVLDKDIKEDSVFKFPDIYMENMKGLFFGAEVFFLWLSRAAFQSAIVFFFSAYYYGSEWITKNGENASETMLSMLAYSCAVYIQSVTIFVASSTVTWINNFMIWGSLVFFLVLTSIVGLFPSLGVFGVNQEVFEDLTYWILSVLITATGLIPLIIAKYVRFNYYPRYFEKIQAYEKGLYVDDGRRESPIELSVAPPDFHRTPSSSGGGSGNTTGLRRKSSTASDSPLIV